MHEEPEDSDEETLPNTATTLFNYLLMGAVLMVIGWISLMTSKKRTNK
ncbi:LPXTG cell wall anchor domain-containing protein [Halolactibacillus sp. JCM 19043]